jgi:hypothetical protein
VVLNPEVFDQLAFQQKAQQKQEDEQQAEVDVGPEGWRSSTGADSGWDARGREW